MKFIRSSLVLVLLCCGPAPQKVEPPHLLWENDAQSLDNPFPDVRLLDGRGAALRPDYYRPFMMQKALTAKMVEVFKGYAASAATQVHGFGNFGLTLLRTSVPVDPASLSGTAVRLKKTGTGFVVLEARPVVEHVTKVLEDTGVDAPASFPEFFWVRPSVPLKEGETGLLVIKKGLKGKDGAEFGRGFAFDGAADKAELAQVAQVLEVPESDILLTLPLKATPTVSVLKPLADWVETPAGLGAVTIPPKGTVPEGNVQRPVGIWKRTDADWSVVQQWVERNGWSRPATNLEAVVFGEIAARDLRENGVWRSDWQADPSKAPVVPLRFVLTVPTGTKPSGGWPVVHAQHGVGGRNVPQTGNADAYCLNEAQFLATKGIGCLGIDAPNHGVRGNFINFFSIESLETIRDEFREMTFDLLQVARAAPTIDVDGDGQGDVNPDLGYLGNSLGGIMGSAYVPVAPRVKYSVLNVPGGGLLNVLVSIDLRDRIGLLFVAKTNIAFGTPEYFVSFPIFRALAQPFFDSGDPVNLGHVLPLDRAVLIQEGLGDLVIPNFTTEDLAAAYGVTQPAATVTGTAPIRAIYRVDPKKFLSASQANGYNGHGVYYDIKPVRDQMLKFLETRGRELLIP